MKYVLRPLFILVFTLAGICLGHADPAGHDISRRVNLDEKQGGQMEQHLKVVFHLDWEQEERLLMALENTKNLFREIPAQQCSVRIVANGKAVNLLRKDRSMKYAGEMEDLHKLGVRFKACRNAMVKNNIQNTDLLEICDVVPAGILELINLQHQGFAYIKP